MKREYIIYFKFYDDIKIVINDTEDEVCINYYDMIDKFVYEKYGKVEYQIIEPTETITIG